MTLLLDRKRERVKKSGGLLQDRKPGWRMSPSWGVATTDWWAKLSSRIVAGQAHACTCSRNKFLRASLTTEPCDHQALLKQILGHRFESNSVSRKIPVTRTGTFLGSGGRTRTYDLVVMSHTSCHCSTPRYSCTCYQTEVNMSTIEHFCLFYFFFELATLPSGRSFFSLSRSKYTPNQAPNAIGMAYK